MNKSILLFLFIISLSYAQMESNQFLLAINYENQGNLDKAFTILQELTANNPDNYQFTEAFLRVAVKSRKYDTAILLLENRIKKNPANFTEYGELGKIYHIKGDEKAAYNAWDKAIELNKQDFVYKAIANYPLERRDFPKAIEILEKGKENSNEKAGFSFDLANLYVLTMNYANAAKEFVDILKFSPQQLNSVQSRILTFSNKPDALNNVIQTVESTKSSDLVFTRLLAWLYKENKNWEKSLELYIELDKEKNDGTEVLTFTQNAAFAKHFEVAAKGYEYLIENYSDMNYIGIAKLGYAYSLESLFFKESDDFSPIQNFDQKSLNKVVDLYNEVITKFKGQAPGNNAALRLGLLLLKANNLKDAADNLYYVSQNGSPELAAEAQQALSKIELINGNVDKAEEILLRLVQNKKLTKDKANPANFMLANIYLYKGDLEKSKIYLADAQNDLQDNYANDAIELSMLIGMEKDTLSLLKYGNALYLYAKGEFNTAAEEFTLLASSNVSILLKSMSEIKAAECYIKIDKNKAVQLLEKVQNEGKNIYSDKALYLLGKFYNNLYNDKAKAVEYFDKLLENYPESLYLDQAREEILSLRKN